MHRVHVCVHPDAVHSHLVARHSHQDAYVFHLYNIVACSCGHICPINLVSASWCMCCIANSLVSLYSGLGGWVLLENCTEARPDGELQRHRPRPRAQGPLSTHILYIHRVHTSCTCIHPVHAHMHPYIHRYSISLPLA